MAEKMMRTAGRGYDGLAKPLKTNNDGVLDVNIRNFESQQFVGNFIEPHDVGYVGNVAVMGLESFGKIALNTSIIAVKAGKNALYVLEQGGVLKKFGKYLESDVPEWIYTGFLGVREFLLLVDANDDIIIAGANDPGHRITEKISGETGQRIWLSNYNSSNYLQSTDVAVDAIGNVYTIGSAGSNKLRSEHLLMKLSGVDGTMLWGYEYTTTEESNFEYLTINAEGLIFVSNRSGIIKIDPRLANATTQPAIVWTYQKPVDGDKGFHIDIDSFGNLYRMEKDFASHRLLKIDPQLANQTTNPSIVWSKEFPSIEGSIHLDSYDFIYLNNGKFDNEGNEIWGETSPVEIHEVREDFIYGVQKTIGNYNEVRSNVFKLGLDLQLKGYKGVK